MTATVPSAPPAPPAYAPPFVQPPAPKGARRPMLFALGAAVAAIGATGSVWWSAQGNKKVDVVVAARDVPYGAVLTSDDLTTAQISADSTVKAVSADQASSLIGKRAATKLISGSLLTSGEVGDLPFPAAGQSIIAVPLKNTQVFYGLRAQSNVLLVATPSPNGAGQAQSAGTVAVSVLVPVAAVGPLEGLITTGQLQMAAAPPAGP